MTLAIRRMTLASDGSRRYYDTLMRIEVSGGKMPEQFLEYGVRQCEQLERSGARVALFVNGQPECCSPFLR